MSTVDAACDRILQLCKEHNITIKLICDGLGITLGEFFSTEEFDTPEQEIR